MAKPRQKVMSIRIDDYIVDYLNELGGNNDCEKIRFLIREAIEYRRNIKKLFTHPQQIGAPTE